MKINIRYFTQLFLSYILLLMVAIVGISILTVSFVKHYVETQTIQSLSQQLTYIDHILKYANHPESLDDVLNDIHTFEGYDVRLTMIAKNGTVFFDSAHNIEFLDNHQDRPEFISAKKNMVGSAIRYSKTLKKTLVYVAKVNQNGGVHRLALPINYLQDELGKISQKIVAYTLAIFGFCLLLTFFMSHWISSPLNWAIKTLHRIKNRKFEKIKPQPSFVKEINNVNRSLVEVSDNISQFIGKISREKEKKDIILNNMINGLLVIDMHLDIRLMNPSAFGLFFNLDATNQSLQLSDYPTVFSFATQLMSGEAIEPIEIEHENGQTILITGAMYTEGEEPRGILTAQDITQQKRLESTRQKFVANVSHELKTPITFIRSMFETLLSAKEKNIDLSIELIQKGVSHTDRLNQIIDDLLQLSKLETTGGEIEKEPANLQGIVDIVIQQCQKRADNKQIQLISTGNDRNVVCNANLLVQALKNLVENAIKYSPEETTVTMSNTETASHIEIHVTDEGPGIEEKHISKLFQRFYRIDNARSRQMGGTGLGLAIVKHIAQSHGGQSTLKSTLKKGTVFTLSLPK